MKRLNKKIIKKETRKNINKKRDELGKEAKKIMDDKIIKKANEKAFKIENVDEIILF